MESDRAMWASIALVDYLRNGVPLEDAPKEHVGRSLAALLNCYRMPLDEYWERRIDMLDGAYDAYFLDQAGYTGWEMVPLMNQYYDAMSAALADRSWDAFRLLPDKVWDLLRHVTGMCSEEWEELPAFCRGLLSQKVTCPACKCADMLDRFGEPDPIDDPTRFYQNRIDLVFHCPKCGTPVTFDVPVGASPQCKPSSPVAKKIFGRAVMGMFIVLMALAFYMIFKRPFF